MKKALKEKNKLSFINGSIQKLVDSDSDELYAWEVCDTIYEGNIFVCFFINERRPIYIGDMYNTVV